MTGKVIVESGDFMLWALWQYDPHGWLGATFTLAAAAPYPALRAWLERYLSSELFA